MRPKGKPSELEARRLEAVQLLKAGKKSSEVARLLGASASSVKRWKDALRQGGPDALKAKRHPGRTPRLTQPQKAELALLLAGGPRAAGFDSDHWTSPQARDLIQRHFGVVFHVGYVWQLLRDSGWTKPANSVARESVVAGSDVAGNAFSNSDITHELLSAGPKASGTVAIHAKPVFAMQPMHAPTAANHAVESSFA